MGPNCPEAGELVPLMVSRPWSAVYYSYDFNSFTIANAIVDSNCDGLNLENLILSHRLGAEAGSKQ